MRILAIAHEADAGPGVFAEEVAARGHRLDEWLVPESAEPPADPASYDAVMAFGGAMHPDQEQAHPWLRTEKALLRSLVADARPVLGVCLGGQVLAEAAGGRSGRAPAPEIGWLEVELTPEGAADPLLGPLAPRFEAFQWHSYGSTLPPGAVALARSPLALQAYRTGERAWGIQFHAEVTEADALAWTANWRQDPDAVAIGLDHRALAAEIRERMGAWNGLGRALCGRFLDLADA